MTSELRWVRDDFGISDGLPARGDFLDASASIDRDRAALPEYIRGDAASLHVLVSAHPLQALGTRSEPTVGRPGCTARASLPVGALDSSSAFMLPHRY
jgi:hypothetical protein